MDIQTILLITQAIIILLLMVGIFTLCKVPRRTHCDMLATSKYHLNQAEHHANETSSDTAT